MWVAMWVFLRASRVVHPSFLQMLVAEEMLGSLRITHPVKKKLAKLSKLEHQRS